MRVAVCFGCAAHVEHGDTLRVGAELERVHRVEQRGVVVRALAPGGVGYPHRRPLGHGLVRAFPGSTRVFGGVRRGKARYVAIAGRTTIARPALLRRYLRAAL